MVSEHTGTYYRVRCDCCGKETMAEIRGDKLVIMDRRHGMKHIAVLTLHDIIALMQEGRKS